MSISIHAKTAVFTFYYHYAALLNRLFPTVRVEHLSLHVPAGTYKPVENEPCLPRHASKGRRALDVGCGCGTISLLASPKFDEILAVDINPQAVEATRRNCELNDVHNITARVSDMFEAVDGVFDTVFANPPFVTLRIAGDANQWATSPDFLDRLFSGACDRLSDRGQLLMLFPASECELLTQYAESNGMRLVAKHRTGAKGLRMSLLALVYGTVGFDSHVYVFERA